MDQAGILADETFCALMEETDPVFRERLTQELAERARELGVKAKFDSLLKAYKAAEKQEEKASKMQKGAQQSLSNWTNFGSDKYRDLFCGNWIATKDGIYTYDLMGQKLACYHPILPVQLLTNIETGAQKVVLAFEKAGRWNEITVPKNVISSNQKIVSLSDMGVSVTSETARYLVRYLADVENYNIDLIPENRSTGKMGWIGGKFMPYNADVDFDEEGRFSDVYAAIRPFGDEEIWLDYVKDIRRQGRLEPRMMMAASCASVLAPICGALPFWFDLWGETGGGKTVCLMLAASIWADPCGYRYIADLKATDVSLELRSDFLNHLPLLLDDTAVVKEAYKDDFSRLIYNLCSGKGKSRSNRDLGIRREQTWQNTIISTGEHPLSNENLQGGAMNRVLELAVGEENIFPDGHEVVSVIARSYGHAGKRFVEAVQELGTDRIKAMQQDFLQQILAADKMEKQSISLSVLLTADKIAADFVFRDGITIGLAEASQVLVDRQALSEQERCYEYILGEIAVNTSKFGTNSFGDRPNELWGEMEDGYAIVLNNVMERICKSGGYSYKAFLSWAARKGLIRTQGGKNTRVKRFGKGQYRCVYLQLKEEEPEEGGLPFEE